MFLSQAWKELASTSNTTFLALALPNLFLQKIRKLFIIFTSTTLLMQIKGKEHLLRETAKSSRPVKLLCKNIVNEQEKVNRLCWPNKRSSTASSSRQKLSKATITRCVLSLRFFCTDATLLSEFESDKI